MPADFDDCRRRGGEIRTVKIKGGRYQHVCYDGRGVHKGHIKTKKKRKSG